MEKLIWKKEEIWEKDKAKGIQRVHVENEIAEIERLNEYAIHHLVKGWIAKRKLKLIRYGFPLVSDNEALRELAEEEIERILKRKRIGKGAVGLEYLSLPYPMIAKRKFYDFGYRVDIKACFYSIYSMIGLDSRIKIEIIDSKTWKYKTVGKGLLNVKNSELVFEIGRYKLLRNTLYGLTRSAFVNVYKPDKKWERQFFKSNLLNPELHAVISLVLHSIVSELSNIYEIVYWNIDGGFLLDRQAVGIDKAVETVYEYGLELKHEKAKNIEITRLGGWKYETEIGAIVESGHYGHAGVLAKDIDVRVKVVNIDEFKKDWGKLCLQR